MKIRLYHPGCAIVFQFTLSHWWPILYYPVIVFTSYAIYQGCAVDYNATRAFSPQDPILKVAAKFLREHLISGLSNEWGVSPSAFQSLPLAILFQASPGSPISLIGCPNNTFPYDLTSCVTEIQNIRPAEGHCLKPSAFYDHQLQSCVVKTTASAYTLCPPGHSVTLSPLSIVRGPCRRTEFLPPIPHCDAPFEFSVKDRLCKFRRAQKGILGCRPGETLFNNTCKAAYQVPKIIRCPSNYTSELSSQHNDVICVFHYNVTGKWDRYTQKPLCPVPTQRPIIVSANSPGSTTDNYAKEWYTNHVTADPRVVCVETATRRPLAVRCPQNSVDFYTYMQTQSNFVPVQTSRTDIDPQLTCVVVDSYPVGPACPSLDQTIFVGPADPIFIYLQEQATQETAQSDPALPSSNSKWIARQLTLKPKTHRVRHGRARLNNPQWPQTGNATGYFPRGIMIHRSNATAIEIDGREVQNEENKINVFQTRFELLDHDLDSYGGNVFPPPELDDYQTSPVKMVEIAEGDQHDLVKVDWTQLVSVDALHEELQIPGGNNEKNLDIDWKELDRSQRLTIACETIVTADPYLTCPKNMHLHKDGRCRGQGYTDFLVFCPEGFHLDVPALARMKPYSSHTRNNIMCTGNSTTETLYTCPMDDKTQHVSTTPANLMQGIASNLEIPDSFYSHVENYRFVRPHESTALPKDVFQAPRRYLVNHKTDSAKLLSTFTIQPEIQSYTKVLFEFPLWHTLRRRLQTQPQNLDDRQRTLNYANDEEFLYALLIELIKRNGINLAIQQNPEPINRLHDQNPHERETNQTALQNLLPDHEVSETAHQQKAPESSQFIVTFPPNLRKILYPEGTSTASYKNSQSLQLASNDTDASLDSNSPRLQWHTHYGKTNSHSSGYTISSKNRASDILDKTQKLCYTVPERHPPWFSPTRDVVYNLYDALTANEFWGSIEGAKVSGGSPFFIWLPKDASARQNYASNTVSDSKQLHEQES